MCYYILFLYQWKTQIKQIVKINWICVKDYGWRSLGLWLFSGYNRRKEQVPHQWFKCPEQPSKGSVLLSSAECKQSPFPHNARTYHKGSQYETARGKYIFFIMLFHRSSFAFASCCLFIIWTFGLVLWYYRWLSS
jgi:hypothetical protein